MTLPLSRGRILLVCYHFAPDPSIGSLRWQKFAKHAAERGWGIDVVMRDQRSIANPDSERVADLPPNVRRIGVPEHVFWFDELEDRLAAAYRRVVPRAPVVDSVRVTQTARPSSMRDVLRAYFSVVRHLRQRRWARDAAIAARAMLDTRVHRVVIGCGPPFSSCVAARYIAETSGLPLVTDLRDPWSLAQRLPEAFASPLTQRFAAQEEQRTIAASALVVANTAPVGDALRALYPNARVVDVPNGYDDEPMPDPVKRDRFVIAYTGTVYLGRSPRALFEALKLVIDRRGLTPEQIRIDFMGAVEQADGIPLGSIAAELGVGNYVHLHAARPRSEALAFLAQASMLVLLPQDGNLSIPGKLYEYMRYDAWILAMAGPQEAVSRLLHGSDASVIPASEVEMIAEVIERRYAQFLAGERGVPVARAERFSRRARASEFFGAMDTVVPGAALTMPAPRAREVHQVLAARAHTSRASDSTKVHSHGGRE